MSKPTNILAGESEEEFDSLSTNLHAEFQPATETERMLVDMMVHHQWLMRRAVRMQQTLMGSAPDESQVDPKRLSLIVRYYRTHERGVAQAKRELDSMRKYKRKSEKAGAAHATREQRQWEQILKKMPTLTNWVN